MQFVKQKIIRIVFIFYLICFNLKKYLEYISSLTILCTYAKIILQISTKSRKIHHNFIISSRRCDRIFINLCESVNGMKKIFNWIKNYLYYYKFRIIAASIALAIAGVAVYQVATKEKYDYSVYLCISKTAMSEFNHSIEASFAQFGEDVNGDGKVNVQVIDLSYDFSDPKSQNALSKTTLLGGELSSGGHYIFIYDERYYEKTLAEMFDKQVGLNEHNGTAAKVSGDALEYIKAGLSSVNFDPESVPEMYISLRKAPSHNEEQMNVYNTEKKLFFNIVNNKPTAK